MKKFSAKTAFCLIVIGLTMASCKKNCCENLATDTGLIDTIGVERAKRYVQNYERDDVKSRNPLVPAMLDNTRAIWFSLDRLKAITCALEKENADGLRIYFAAYDSTYDKLAQTVPPKDYWGHNTLVLVSTENKNGIHQDYYRNATNTNRGIIIMMVPQNRGEMCPPPSPCEGADLLE